MKNNSINTFFSCLAAFFFVSAAQAQEWQVEGAGHLIQHPGDDSFPMAKHSEGYSFGIGYNQYFNDNWSIGLGLSYFKTDLTFAASQIKGTSMEVDMEGDPFEFRYSTGYFKESVVWQSVRIPLTVQFETSGVVRWYLRTGVLYGLQLGNSKYRQEWNNLTTSGYYPEWDAELTGPEFAGFGSMGNKRTEGTVKLRNTFSWVLETGVKQTLNTGNSLYLGLFFEMGLNDMRPSTVAETQPVEYTPNLDQPLTLNSVLNQSQYKENTIMPTMFGFKIRYGFQF
ncbi:Outer membrane protein beta-barrel domain-containing protein [Paenimyroides ummariense]|uniref:Outer membrane protein beta-barrel domain-containing protein n=1 Tax=Paenimyroides ummariense TaxID=913024 RepID=A0A1I5DSN4_9FLAO|nr:outer membrane beta-barrel protein [Paenimyroides ummariense]SFO02262.1 Outer membrane protein beta-barrel domain-containing protein [Paenimyroides ummariense]